MWLTRAYVVLLHAVTGMFFYGMARLYVYIHGDVALKFTIQIAIGARSTDFYIYVVMLCYAVALGHALALLVMLAKAVKRRQGCQAQQEEQKLCKKKLARWFKRVKDKFTHWHEAAEKAIGVDFHLLEVVAEVLLQTFQMYKMSSLVAVVWINRLLVLVLVTNCWFVPLVQVALRKKPSTQTKILLLVFDSLLDVVYAMVIPLAILYPHYKDYNTTQGSTSSINQYMDTWTINTAASLQQLFVTSWLDLIAKMAPGAGLLLRLASIQALAEKLAAKKRASDAGVSRVASAFEITEQRRAIWKKRAVNGSLFLWGLLLLVLHLTTSIVVWLHSDRGCLLEMRPIGSIQYTCVVYEVSCSQKGISGTADELDVALTRVHAPNLLGLIVSHCPALTMSPRIKSFPRLKAIKIHNSTFVDWNLEAALTREAHPAIQSLFLTMVSMTGIPEGLQSPDFPPTLFDIQMSATNLTALPADLFSTAWHRVLSFALERSPGITEVPPALVSPSTNTWALSLAGNAIHTLPDDLFTTRNYYSLILDRNPLRTLPESVGMLPAAKALSIGFTDIAVLPTSWFTASTKDVNAAMAAMLGFQVAALNTTLCEDALAQQQSRSGASVGNDNGVIQVDWLPVNCASGPSVDGYKYPLEHELEWRERNRH